MKQLITTHIGGHPLHLDDLEHMQNGTKESLIAIMKGLLNNGASVPNCILYGVNATVIPGTGGLVASVTAGAVVLDGEICLFDGIGAVSLDPNPDTLVLAPLDTYLASNPVTYANGTTKNVHLVRKAQMLVISGAPASNHLVVAGMKTLIELFKDSLSGPGTFIPVAFPNYPWIDASNYFLEYRKNVFTNLLELKGRLKLQNMTTMANPSYRYNLFTLPSGYKPACKNNHFVPICIDYLNDFPLHTPTGDRIVGLNMQVDTGGNVSINIHRTTATFEVEFYISLPLV
jgi:hypothetical protein